MPKIEWLMEVNLEVLIRTSSPEMLIHFKIWVLTFLYWPSSLLVELVLINIFLTRFCYGLEQFAVVMASIPGYKPKSTIIWLEETATADFILDPDITLQGNTLGSICDCSLMVRQRLSCWSFFGVPHWSLFCFDCYCGIRLLFIKDETEIHSWKTKTVNERVSCGIKRSSV